MDRLEEQIRQALARVDAPSGFAGRVTASAQRRRWWGREARGALAAGLVLLVVGGGAAWRRHQGEVAREQVMTAMRITAVKLNRIQAHVREVRR